MPIANNREVLIYSDSQLDTILSEIENHSFRHNSGGGDALKLNELAAPTADITALNASISVNGLLKKLPNDATKYINGVGNWTVPAGSGGSVGTYYNVLDYGLVGDGSTDNSSAMAALVTTVANSGEGTIFFPPGHYCMNNIQIPGMIYVEGSGVNTMIMNNSTTHCAMQFGITAPVYNSGIRNIWFTQDSRYTAVAGNCAIYVNQVGNFWMEDVCVQNSIGAPYDGIRILGSAVNILSVACEMFIENCFIQGCINAGIYVFNSTELYITNLFSWINKYGLYAVDAFGIVAENCNFYENTEYGVYLANGTLTQNYNHQFSNCASQTSGKDNWYCDGIANSQFSGCWGAWQIAKNVNATANGFTILGATMVTLEGCNGFQNNNHGVEIQGTLCNIVGGQYNDNSQYGAANLGNGIFFDVTNGLVTGIVAADDQGTHTQYAGVFLYNSINVNVKNNIFVSNTSAGVSKGGSNTNCRISDNQGYVTENNGSSTGTGSLQTIAHGLVGTPNNVNIVPTASGTATVNYANGTNIYVTVTNGIAYNWTALIL